VTAAWAAESEWRGRLIVDIADTGPGVAPEAQDRIFQRFEQGDGSMSRRYGGVGLGLAIARDLARRMGGDVELKESGRRGSVFRFWITADVRPDPEDALAFPDVVAVVAGPANAERASLIERLARFGVSARPIDRMEDVPGAVEDLIPRPGLVIADASDRTGLGALAKALGEIPNAPKLAVAARFGAADFGEEIDAAIAWSLLRPVREADIVAMLRHLTDAGADGEEEPPVLGLKVLVAEDNPVNVEVTRGMLERLGCAVAVAENGLAAADAFEVEGAAGGFDAVLMDCQMPVMDGYEAARQIREQEGGGGATPIIAVTANAFEEDRVACFAAGMSDFMAKPLTLKGLTSRLVPIARALGKLEEARAGEEAAAPVSAAPAAALSVTPLKTDAPAKRAFKVIDDGALNEIRKLSKDGDAMVQRVVGVFLKSTPGLAADLDAAIEAGDAEAARRHADALKSATRNVGSVELPDMLADIEALAKSGDVNGVRAAAAELGRAFDDLTLALKTLQARN